MSTVSQLVAEIQDRIPEDKWEGLFPVINRAVRTISTRLFTLKSDLIVSNFHIYAWGLVDYTAGTIGFTAGTSAAAPTITDSAAQFVVEKFAAGMHVSTDSLLNPGPFKISSVAAGVLTLVTTDTVVTEAAGASLTITSDPSFADLPTDFWGLVEKGAKPSISTKVFTLLPLPDDDLPIQFKSGGDPYWYSIKGMKMYLTPPTGSNVTIQGDYFSKPATLTRMSDTVPYNELLDSAIQEMLIEVLVNGMAMSDAKLEAFLQKQVDIIVNNRSLTAPTSMPMGINWGAL
jgi:hypothetical protein